MQREGLRVALVHDSLTQLGGAERVVDALHEMFPEAPVFTLVFDRKLKEHYWGWDIRTSWLQVIYNFFPKFQWLFPLIPLAMRSLDLEGYDVIISSSSSFAKNIHVPKKSVHINYCHTPTRFLWVDENYVQQEVPKILWPAAKVLIAWMKKWDYKGAQRVTHFIANSKEVQNRIKKYYGRDSVIIHPYINTDFWRPTVPKKDYFLIAGRLQAHKNNEAIVEVFNELGVPLHVVGTGRQEQYLKSIAKQNVTFLGRVSDEKLRDEYSGALGYIYPQLEDFGLMPLEAAACGTATLALGQGGALETVVPGVTGEFFNALDKELIKQHILHWNADKYNPDALNLHAQKFSKENFKKSLADFFGKIAF